MCLMAFFIYHLLETRYPSERRAEGQKKAIEQKLESRTKPVFDKDKYTVVFVLGESFDFLLMCVCCVCVLLNFSRKLSNLW